MSSTMSLPASLPSRSAWSDVVLDVRDGALATARLVVTLSGCAALAATVVLVNHEGAWSALRAAVSVPTAVASVVADDASGSPAADANAGPTAVVVPADPRQKNVVQYLSRRYRVAEEATRMLVAAAFQIGHESRIDPLLILSVVAIESSLNPFAESSMGAQGLMQVMPRIHAERFAPHGGQLAALDPIANMKVGSAILGDLIARGGSVERGLQLYVGAGNLPDDGGYGARVLGERARLALASAGKVDTAIANARSAPVVPETKQAATAAAGPAQPTPQPAENVQPEGPTAPGRSA
jgi:soluble lytic murein transglycosylase-like protein